MEKISVRYGKRKTNNPTYGHILLYLWNWMLPVAKNLARVCDGYGWVKSFGGRWHEGIDIDGDKLDVQNDPLDGKHVFSPCNGVVTFSGICGGYGNMIEIANDGLNNGYKLFWRLGHLSARYVYGRDKVTKGQLIGLVGSTGHSTSPHIHIECWAQKYLFGKIKIGSKFTIDPYILLRKDLI